MSYRVEYILDPRRVSGQTDWVTDRRLVGSPHQGWLIPFLELNFCHSCIKAHLHIFHLKLINNVMLLKLYIFQYTKYTTHFLIFILKPSVFNSSKCEKFYFLFRHSKYKQKYIIISINNTVYTLYLQNKIEWVHLVIENYKMIFLQMVNNNKCNR